MMNQHIRNSLGLALTLCIGTSGAFAQTYQEAKKLLQASSERMKSFDNLYLEFNYSLENHKVEPPVRQNEQGTIAIQNDNYHLSFLGTEQIRQGQKLYTILTEDEEVQVTTYDPEDDEQGLTPTRILSLYQEGYTYKMGRRESINGRDIQYVELQPVASDITEKIEIGIDRASLIVYSLKQIDVSGSITHFVVTQAEPNKDFPSDYFSFKASDYPGYYIAD